MRITFESKGDFSNTRAWLAKVLNGAPIDTLQKIAKDGEQSLASNTPKDTGETAAGWTSEITSRRSGSEIAWMNTAHPHTTLNVAKLIDQGHGTGTGGYVPPRPYIQKSMDAVWKNAGNDIAKGMSE